MAGVNAWDDENFPVSLYIQEPYDPTKIPMYCKDKVYGNGMECEYSLEEIRARRYGYGNILRKNSDSPSTLKGILPATSACREVEVKPLSDIDVNAKHPKESTGRKTPPVMKAQIESSLMKDCFKTPVITAAFIDKENQENFKRAKNILHADVLPCNPIGDSLGFGKEIDKENLQHTYGVNYLEDDGLSAFDATSYTKAFNAPIPSSTPFIGDRIALKCKRKESDNINSANENTFIVPPVAPVKELSVIEESSKEMMVGSIGTTSGVSSAESERVANPNGRSYSHSVHGGVAQTSSVIAEENVAPRKTISSCIPIPVNRDSSKEIVRTSKEGQRIQKLKELTEEEKLCNLMGEVILSDDPFDHDSNLNHLKSITLPAKEREGFFSISCKAPVLKSNSDISLRQDQGDGHLLKSLKVIGQGAYAKVYKAFSSKYRQTVAIKLQKPACEWEFYISRKIHERIQDFHMRSSFMEVKEAYLFLDGSLLIYDYMEYGTLLNVINLYKVRGTKLPEVLALYFAINLLKILSCLHTCHIIHGDIKPDNFLLRKIPSEKPNGIQPSLQLIDLGRCIDMTLYPEGACFSTVFQKSHFQCVEMRTKRPWSYQLDLFGAASVVHCLVFGEFMEVHCKNNIWNINKKVPRNMNQQLWQNLFDTFLNISSCNKLPNIDEMVKEMEAYYISELANEMGPAVVNLRRMLNEDCAKRK